MTIAINLSKAKDIAHQHRRDARAVEFAPLDDIIAKQLPDMNADLAEARRQAIRDHYMDVQDEIDDAGDPDALLPIVTEMQTIIAESRT